MSAACAAVQAKRNAHLIAIMSDNDPSFSEYRLWKKIAKHAKTIGRHLVEQALILANTLKDPDTPVWARGTILSALAYFLSPLDLIPDFIPVAGYSDDLTAIAAAIAAVAVHIKEAHRIAARTKADSWFGPRPDTKNDP
ncbi:MAG: YkvA family protein [Verrucomicrobiota bacterium]